MRYLDLKKNRDGWISLKDICRGSRMHWIIVDLKILDLMDTLLHGAIEDQETIMFGFVWTVGWQQWIGFYGFLLAVSIT